MPVRILSSKTNNFGKDSHPKLPSGWFLTFSHTQRGSISRPSSWETNVRSAVLCDTLLMFSVKTIYMMFDGFSTPVISFWLICTTRRWDRGSVWGRILFLSEFFFFKYLCKNPFCQSLETKLRFTVWTVYCPLKNCECFLFANKNSLRNTTYFSIV